MHIKTMLILNRDPQENYNNIYYGLTIAVVTLSSYSLFSKPIPESTPYLTSDSFSVFSAHYQRVGYSVLIVGCVCITEFSAADTGDLNYLQGSFAIAYIVHFVVLVLQMLGILGNPMVSVMWFLEQADVHVFGSTPRASDFRIVLSFCLNSAIVIGIYFLGHENHKLAEAVIMGVILAWVFSHNAMFGIGMIRPFKIVNEKLEQQKEYSQIVFSQIQGMIEKQTKVEGKCPNICGKIMGFLFKTLVGGGITIALNIIAMKVINIVD